MGNFTAGARAIKRHLVDFRSVWVAFIIFYLVTLAIFLLITWHPPLLDWLKLSANRPWGIVTSAFVHVDLDHLLGNLIFFSLWTTIFVGVNLPRDAETRRFSSRVFLLLIFLSGFLANTIVLFGWLASGVSKNAWGASGIVYAVAGVCLASTIGNFSDYWRGLFGPGIFWKKLVNLSWAAFIMVLLVWYVIQDPRAFLNVAPEVNVYAHFWGFFLGFIPFLIIVSIRSLKIWKNSRGRSGIIRTSYPPTWAMIDHRKAAQDVPTGRRDDPLGSEVSTHHGG